MIFAPFNNFFYNDKFYGTATFFFPLLLANYCSSSELFTNFFSALFLSILLFHHRLSFYIFFLNVEKKRKAQQNNIQSFFSQTYNP